MGEQIFISETYGSGGRRWTTEVYKNKISLVSGSQEYDLNELLVEDDSGSGPIEVKRVFYESDSALSQDTLTYMQVQDQQTNNMLDAFGFGGSSPKCN